MRRFYFELEKMKAKFSVMVYQVRLKMNIFTLTVPDLKWSSEFSLSAATQRPKVLPYFKYFR